MYETPDPINKLETSFAESHINDLKNKKQMPSRSASKSPLSSASSSKSIIYAMNPESSDDVRTPQIRVDNVSPVSSDSPPPLPPRSRNNSSAAQTENELSPQRNQLIRRSVPITKQNNRIRPDEHRIPACQRG
jgi:phage repressor protein C with HTH and peptisase S24 domain